MPAVQAEQTALGERILRIFGDAGAEIIAEDLGVIPDFVRESLTRLGIPGYRVFRWERHWHQAGQPYRDPAEYPPQIGRHVRHTRYGAARDLVGGSRAGGTSRGAGDTVDSTPDERG